MRLRKHPIFSNPGTLLLFTALGAVALFQGALLVKEARPNLLRVYRDAGQHAVWRGARFSHGVNFAQYTAFLNEAVPEYARVVLPPPGFGPKYLRSTPNMQFFLAPRQVMNCTDLNCLEDIDRQNTYILAVEGFPGDDYPSLSRGAIMFDESWGLIPPEGVPIGGGIPLDGYNSLLEIILAGLPPLLWLAVLAFSGAMIFHALLPGFGLLIKAGLGYSFGLSIFSFALGYLSLLGLPVNQATVLWVTGALLVLSFFTGLYVSRRKSEEGVGSPSSQKGSGFVDIWLALFLLLALLSLLLGVGKGYYATDEILLWGAKGYGIAATESLREIIQWGTNTVPYPLQVPILIASAKLLFGEALPASKMIFSGYYLALMLVIYQYLLEGGVRRVLAGLSVLLIGTLPIVFRHSTIAYANLPMSFYFVGAVLLLTRSLVDSGSRRVEKAALLSGILFACAAWTRPEALVMAWLTTAFILVAYYLISRNRFSFRFISYLFAPLALYSLFWLAFKTIIYSIMLDQPDPSSEVLSQVSRGNLHINEALFVIASTFKRLLDYQTWGALGLGLILLAVSLILARGSRQPGVLIVLSGIFVIGMTAGIYYLVSFDSVHDVSWWISTGYDRMLLPGILLVLIGGGLLSREFFDDRQRGAVSFDPE